MKKYKVNDAVVRLKFWHESYHFYFSIRGIVFSFAETRSLLILKKISSQKNSFFHLTETFQ